MKILCRQYGLTEISQHSLPNPASNSSLSISLRPVFLHQIFIIGLVFYVPCSFDRLKHNIALRGKSFFLSFHKSVLMQRRLPAPQSGSLPLFAPLLYNMPYCKSTFPASCGDRCTSVPTSQPPARWSMLHRDLPQWSHDTEPDVPSRSSLPPSCGHDPDAPCHPW